MLHYPSCPTLSYPDPGHVFKLLVATPKLIVGPTGGSEPSVLETALGVLSWKKPWSLVPGV